MILEMQRLLGQYKANLRDARCAMVASQPASFGMQRVFAVRAESVSVDVSVFVDIEPARRWLVDRTLKEVWEKQRSPNSRQRSKLD